MEEFSMTRNHWIMIVIVAALAYLIGVKYPLYGSEALAKVGL
jgi:hypothetical protein